ncbi:hypothetical protein FQA39_LY13250 [Lamprigera yunnana]|nr:hypothetical protein FQA39_LY13250 [Lamprigera yunnana]
MFPDAIYKMLIDDISVGIIQLFFAIVIVIVVCLAWRSTNITEQPHYRTVFLLERRLRRRVPVTQLSRHIQSSSIEGEQIEETPPVESDVPPSEDVPNREENRPAATTSTNTNLSDTEGTSSSAEEELANIVQIMDADTNEVRNRRIAYYKSLRALNQERNEHVEEFESSTSVSTDTSRESSLEIMENEKNTVMADNYVEKEPSKIEIVRDENVEETKSGSSGSENSDSNIRIKLKYLNDELKLVDGRLEEQLGDFKRRHFHPEFASNKLVRLIFNGQVLQSDNETLQNCGLFDNCVVHCLVHQQQRNNYNESNNNDTFPNTRSGNAGLPQNSNQGRDWDLGNTLLVLVSLILVSAWYFRYEYAHLYTVTATVALVAITGIFTVFLVGVYFPDSDHLPPPPNEQETT